MQVLYSKNGDSFARGYVLVFHDVRSERFERPQADIRIDLQSIAKDYNHEFSGNSQ